MIKILVEEPVIYQNIPYINSDPSNPDTWIYKNPTKQEISKLDLNSNVRLLTNKNDIYLATGYFWIHSEMAKTLYRYNKLSYDDYKCYYIDIRDNELTAGDKYLSLRKSQEILKELKPFIPQLKELGLVDDLTLVSYYKGIMELKDFYK